MYIRYETFTCTRKRYHTLFRVVTGGFKTLIIIAQVVAVVCYFMVTAAYAIETTINN